MPEGLRRYLTVLVLLAATLAGQPRWLDDKTSDDAPQRSLLRGLEIDCSRATAVVRSDKIRIERLEHDDMADPIRPIVSVRPQPTVLRGAGAPRAPDGLRPL